MVKKIKIIWSSRAEKDLMIIYDYYAIISLQIAKSLVLGITRRVESLKNGFVNIGQKEILLERKGFKYRYLVYRNYKIIYRVENNSIIVITIYDSRQDPEKLFDLTE